MARAGDDTKLVGIVGPAAARALQDWADATGRTVAPTRRRWVARGYTGAVLTAIAVTEPGQPDRKVVLKVCPPGRHVAEAAAHRRALAESPPAFARAHLVGQPYDPYPVGDGSLLMFQHVATGSLLELLPLDALDGVDLAESCRQVTTGVLARWNPANHRIAGHDAAGYLRLELRGVAGGGKLARWATGIGLDTEPGGPRWLTFPGSRPPAPNPLLLHQPGSLLAGIELDVLLGRAHGDLHTQNVLIPRDRGRVRADRYQLVDLSTFAPDAPLTRDHATLLLSLLAPRLALLAGPARLALVDYLVTPDGDRRPLPSSVLAVVDAVAIAADRAVRPHGWADEWRAQFLLSLVSTGLVFVTFERLSAVDRWWYFLLSARAAREFLEMHGRTTPPEGAPSPGAPVQPPAGERPVDGGLAAESTGRPADTAVSATASGGQAAPNRLGGTRPALEPHEAVARLTDLLLACAALESGPQRDLVVSGLPRNIRTAVRRYDGARADVLSIVRTCTRYRNGVRDLLAAVRLVEVGTSAADRLGEVADDLLRAIDPDAG